MAGDLPLDMDAETPNADVQKPASHAGSIQEEKQEQRSTVDPAPEYATVPLDVEKEAIQPAELTGNEEPEYPSTRKLVPILCAMYMAFFLVALVCITSPHHVRPYR